jgi:hypothetical protein
MNVYVIINADDDIIFIIMYAQMWASSALLKNAVSAIQTPAEEVSFYNFNLIKLHLLEV